MNRILIAAIVIIIAACVGLYFWAESEIARFDALLPQPPAVEEQQVIDDTVKETTTGGHWHGDEWHAEPHAEEAPPVQPETPPPVATDETEAVELPPLPPTELELEHEAIKADFNALLEQRDTLSPAEYQKGQRDIADRWQAWHDKFDKLVKERAAAIREMEAKQAEENNQ